MDFMSFRNSVEYPKSSGELVEMPSLVTRVNCTRSSFVMDIAFVFAKLVFASEGIGSTAVTASNIAWERSALQMNCLDVTLQLVVSVKKLVRSTSSEATLQDFCALATRGNRSDRRANNEMLLSRCITRHMPLRGLLVVWNLLIVRISTIRRCSGMSAQDQDTCNSCGRILGPVRTGQQSRDRRRA